jgi:hypothetical protein
MDSALYKIVLWAEALYYVKTFIGKMQYASSYFKKPRKIGAESRTADARRRRE